MDASKWIEIVAPFYKAIGELNEDVVRRSEHFPSDWLRLRREEIDEKFEDAKAELAKAAKLAKNNSVADLSRRGFLHSSLKESTFKSIDERAGNELEKLHREYNRAIEKLAVLEREVGNRKREMHIVSQKLIFVSHSSTDKELVDRFVDLLITGVGVSRESIFCTSLEQMGVPAGENFVDFIKSQIQSPQIVLMVISPNYLKSKFCLCEMGACWAMSHKGIPLLAESISFAELDGVVTSKQAIKLSDGPGLSELKDIIATELSLNHNTPMWERKRDSFIDSLANVETTGTTPALPYPPSHRLRSASTVPTRLERLIAHVETERSELGNGDPSPALRRMCGRVSESIKKLLENSLADGLSTTQLQKAMEKFDYIANVPAITEYRTMYAMLTDAIKMLKEHHRFLLLEV